MTELAQFLPFVYLAIGIWMLSKGIDIVIKAVTEVDTMVRSHLHFYKANVAYDRLKLRTVTQSSPKVRLTCRWRHRR
jgi:hypothetical protein